MHRTCKHLFASTVLSRNKHICIGRSDSLNKRLKRKHGVALAPIHGVVVIGSRISRLPAARSLQQRVDKPCIVPRLYDEIDRALLHSSHGEVYVTVSSKQHYRQVGIKTLHTVQPIYAFIAGVDSRTEIHVKQQAVGNTVTQHLFKPYRRLKRNHLIEIGTQQKANRSKHTPIIVDYNYFIAFTHNGQIYKIIV